MSHRDLDYAGQRLQWVGSRVVESEEAGARVIPTRHQHHSHHSHGSAEGSSSEKGRRHTPKFLKTHSATNFELFYDLWFVANLSVFTSKHDISDLSKFYSFIGYIVLLWTTWLLTSLYDVRFTADSVWERCCKAVHLGVMIGFAEIGAAFDPNDQIVSVFRAMSLFLAVSRFVLALQYGMVTFQIRNYAHGKRPMFITAVLHFCAAAIYFGVSFRYNLGKTSRVFLVWYIGGVIEMALHLRISQLSHVLTFLGTHLGERLNLLTLVILGEGCIILAKSISLLVKDTYLKDASYSVWSPTLIGLVAAGTALIYIIFQLYFDWMHDEHSMSRRHQVMWTAVHLPFHMALTLLVEGANQFIVWARILETADAALEKVVTLQYSFTNMTSEEVSEKLAGVVEPFLEKYPPADIIDTLDSVNESLENIASLPNSFWNDTPPDNSTQTQYQNDLVELMNTMLNAVYTAFEIEPPEEETSAERPEYWQSEAATAIAKRFILVYIYAFACAGIVLLFLTIMHVISKRKGWSPFNIFRTAICISISIVLALLTIVVANQDAVLKGDRRTAFYGSSWMLPTITISYFVVLVLTHLPHPSGFWMGRFGKASHKTNRVPRGPRNNHIPATMPKKNDHVTDFEDMPAGSSSGEYNTISPLPAPSDERRARQARRQRRSDERRSHEIGAHGQAYRHEQGGQGYYR